MENNQLELATQKILKIINKPNKSFLFYGGWGIGKTHLFKKEIYSKLSEEGKNVIYYDIRNSLFHNDPISIFRDMFSEQKTKQKKIQVTKKAFNAVSTLSNIVFKTNIPMTNTEQNLSKVINELNSKETFIIFDEFDRVSGDVILKSLNLLNIISMNENIKIICVGNQKEMNSTLSKSLGENTVRAENFLYKYFEKEVDLDKLILIPTIENILKENHFPSCKWIYEIHETSIKKSSRMIERWIKDIQWIAPSCSESVLKYSLFTYITNFNSHNRVGIFSNALQIPLSNSRDLTIHSDSLFTIKGYEFAFARRGYTQDEHFVIPKIVQLLDNEEECKTILKNNFDFDFDAKKSI